MLDDYTKAEFPLDLHWPNGNSRVRLYGTIGKRVIGASFRTYEVDGEICEDFGQSLDWDGQGLFGSNADQYPTMHLPLPPAMRESRVTALQDEIDAARDRLNSFPDAPPEWRAADERKIASNEEKIAQIRKADQ